MKGNARVVFGGAVVLWLCFVGSATFAATVLSKAQQDVVAAQIAELQTSEERGMASEWSDAKKVAEFICRPLAMSEVKKWNKDADRVFLGTDDPDTLDLPTNRLLTGSGQVRTGNDWTTFTFNCELDAGTGKALSFETSLSSK
ncbi:DUF930 domain-containing protein [Mesorhizobium sp. WSM2239]|uniref:DUF930 domain-containing protein n=2 Tax=unclassified Mesorhizobium TaxID=325217 RepID=A0AAU8D5F8_9HYPH